MLGPFVVAEDLLGDVLRRLYGNGSQRSYGSYDTLQSSDLLHAQIQVGAEKK